MSTIKTDRIEPLGSTIVVNGGLTVGSAAYFTSGVTFGSAVTVNGGLTVGSAAYFSRGVSFASDLSVGTATLSKPSGTAPLFAARAWGYFVGNGASNPTGVTGGNISSIIRHASAELGVTFTEQMPSSSYVVVFGGSNELDGSGLFNTVKGTQTAGGFRIRNSNFTGSPSDIGIGDVGYFSVFC